MEIIKADFNDIKKVVRGAVDYPARLGEIYDPPPLLYYRGDLSCLAKYSRGCSLFSERPILAIVGARRATVYSDQVIKRLVKDLVNCGFIIVSGLALGVDTLAHQATLENRGTTIAVLGSGLDRESFYPPENWKLAQEIVKNGGAVISEFPPGAPPRKMNFPQRNRLLSGLAQGILVIEAGEKSGALITARHALEQNREVLAVPGNIFSDLSIGANNLIKQGARAVTDINDILEAFNLEKIMAASSTSNRDSEKNFLTENSAAAKIFSVLSTNPLAVDEIAARVALDIAAVNSTLSIMELKEMIRNVGFNRYIINNF